MKIITVDPTLQTIVLEDHVGQVDWKAITKRIGCSTMQLAGEFPNGDLLWVDEEGLLKGAQNAFAVPELGQPNLMGIGVVTGPEDDDGNLTDATTEIAWLSRRVEFLGRMVMKGVDVTQRDEGDMRIITVKSTIEPA